VNSVPSHATAASAVASPRPAPIGGGDAEPAWFPLGGVLLLVALVAVALAAMRIGARPGHGGSWRWRAAFAGEAPPGAPALVHAQRVDAQTRLVVVRWHGAELLLGVDAHGAAALLDRRAAEPERPA
jgi:hypothetical protein